MTKDQALRLALEALELHGKQYPHMVKGYCLDAITAIKEALETKDEPVAWGMKKDGVILDVICPEEHEREEGSYTVPLYTTPQRTWVGLTDKERQEIHGSTKSPYDDLLLVEAKLKKKNNPPKEKDIKD